MQIITIDEDEIDFLGAQEWIWDLFADWLERGGDESAFCNALTKVSEDIQVKAVSPVQ